MEVLFKAIKYREERVLCKGHRLQKRQKGNQRYTN